MREKNQVLGIGNAMIDILVECTEQILVQNRIKKGFMELIHLDKAERLYNSFANQNQVSGGSGANTMVGLASLGATTSYIGKVKNDALGKKFSKDLLAMGVNYKTQFADEKNSAETGRCMVFVTPDGERSMNTYLGVTEYLGESDIDSETISQSAWIYLEGYRFDGKDSELAFAKAIETAKRNFCKIALTLSDPFCVERNISAFKEMITNDIDLLFCNEAELKLLYNTKNLDEAVQRGSKDVELVACTVAEKGVVIANKGNIISVPAKNTKVVDTTGAGDLFAAGFLYGLLQNENMVMCGNMGNLAASEIISHLGARPNSDLKLLFAHQLMSY